MITARHPDGLRVVMQVDHQAQCGLMAARWGNGDFHRPEPWQPIADACAWHDEGWRDWERTPGVLPDGAPRGFSQMDTAEHMAIHRRSIAAAADREPVAGMLVAMHCAGLVQRRMGLDGEMPDIDALPGPARDLVRDEATHRAVLEARLGEGAHGWVWAAYRVLQAIDLLSLYLTWRGLVGDECWTLRRVPRALDDDAGVPVAVTRVDARTCALDPWPFAGDALDVPVLARVIDDRPYSDDAALQAALRAAPVAPVSFRAIPG